MTGSKENFKNNLLKTCPFFPNTPKTARKKISKSLFANFSMKIFLFP